MIEEWPGISASRRESLRRIEQFLASHSVPPSDYAYVWKVNPPASAAYVVRYGLDDRDGLNASFLYRRPLGDVEFQTDGQTALTVLCVIAANPDLVDRVGAPTSDLGEVLDRFGIDHRYLKPKLGQFDVGLAVAPHGEGAVVFDVDQRGEVTVLARGSCLAAAFLLKAVLLDRQQGVRRAVDADRSGAI